MIIDGNNLILGRVATIAAKKSLEGEQVTIVNCENMVVTGRKEFLISKFKERQEKGTPYYGPFFPRMPDRIVKRAIRGMLPYKKERGRDALKRIKCFIGTPDKLKSQNLETIQSADYGRLKTLNFIRVGDYSKYYGKNFRQ